ncbi:MAG: outer membrane protein assembly factor BamD [Rickettsiales bacterium]|nr:MAG: outer membrane protein assembly factor BamD [Rickettsiales bacterium]
MNYIKSLSLIALASFALVSCKSKPKDTDAITPAAEIYQAGVGMLAEKQYKNAALEFEKIFFQHPGNEITPRAELMQAYSLYLDGEYDEAVDVLEIFIKLHPRHSDIAYAYYLKALSNYTQISNVKLDQSRTRYAREGLREVIKRFPGTKYATDAALKIDLVNDHLAGKEMMVGRYYLNKKNPIAAIKRFQTVIDKYDTTSHTPEALHRLVESNLMLGLTEEAKKYAAVLNHNYHDSQWYGYSYNLLK